MAKFTAKTAEAARKMVAAIMPNAGPEKKNGFVVGLGKSQNRFFADEVSGNSYCEAYADDCETLTHINIFNDCNDVVATIEIGESDTAIDEIREALGIENVAAKVDVADYAVSVEAQEVAVNAEIENAGKANAAAELAAENAHKERENFFKNLYLKMCGDYYIATGFVQYVTDYAKVVYRKDGDKYIEDAAAFAELKAMENKMKELYHKAHELNNIAAKVEKSNAEIIACIDDYLVNADAAAMVEIENEMNNRLAEENKRHSFIENVLNMGEKILLIPNGDFGFSAALLTARKVAFRDFDYLKTDDGNYHVEICRNGHYTRSTVAVYETEEQAQEVIKMLGAAIQRGKKKERERSFLTERRFKKNAVSIAEKIGRRKQITADACRRRR